MRKWGPSGGGTVRRRSPQQGQRPFGSVRSARSQRPRASHCGLMHCTVKPGKYCICFPISAPWLVFPAGGANGCQPSTYGRDVGGDCGVTVLWCQEKRPLDMVVAVQRVRKSKGSLRRQECLGGTFDVLPIGKRNRCRRSSVVDDIGGARGGGRLKAGRRR